MKPRQILIVNDDGISAPGIVRLAQAAAAFGTVTVVAPDGQRSAVSHRLNYSEPMDVIRADFPVEGVAAYSCSGSPADCVRVGLKLLNWHADAVLSGINYGYNISADIQYSGTVGAALEAAFKGVPAIAVSQHQEDRHEVSDHYLPGLLAEYLDKPLEGQRIWNINFPGCALSECKGVKRDCTVSQDGYYEDDYSVETVGDGHLRMQLLNTRHWIGSPGTDLEAIQNNYVSVGIVNNIC